MTQTKQKSTRTTMYSVDEDGRVVTHHLPWPKDSPKLEALKARGFTFERPVRENLGAYLDKAIESERAALDAGPLPRERLMEVPAVPMKVTLTPADRMAKARAARKVARAKAGKV